MERKKETKEERPRPARGCRWLVMTWAEPCRSYARLVARGLSAEGAKSKSRSAITAPALSARRARRDRSSATCSSNPPPSRRRSRLRRPRFYSLRVKALVREVPKGRGAGAGVSVRGRRLSRPPRCVSVSRPQSSGDSHLDRRCGRLEGRAAEITSPDADWCSLLETAVALAGDRGLSPRKAARRLLGLARAPADGRGYHARGAGITEVLRSAKR